SAIGPNTGSVAVTAAPACFAFSCATRCVTVASEERVVLSLAAYSAAWAASALLSASAIALATAGIVAGSYQRCGLSPAFRPVSWAAFTTIRFGRGAAAINFSIQGA